ncbi:MAG: type II toxin-antitoxin system HicA family toxin [Candidatus Anammoxibacter sp.]
MKRLKKDGWYKVDQNGSHIQFKHPIKKGRVTVKHPVKDVTLDNIKSMEKQSDIKLR